MVRQPPIPRQRRGHRLAPSTLQPRDESSSTSHRLLCRDALRRGPGSIVGLLTPPEPKPPVISYDPYGTITTSGTEATRPPERRTERPQTSWALPAAGEDHSVRPQTDRRRPRFTGGDLVGKAGFELAASASPTLPSGLNSFRDHIASVHNRYGLATAEIVAMGWPGLAAPDRRTASQLGSHQAAEVARTTATA
jgi:hypothetical protein